jgi:hypothetical protein
LANLSESPGHFAFDQVEIDIPIPLPDLIEELE